MREFKAQGLDEHLRLETSETGRIGFTGGAPAERHAGCVPVLRGPRGPRAERRGERQSRGVTCLTLLV